MKNLHFNHIIIPIFTIFGMSLNAQSPEQIVRDAENSINQKIEQVHQLAVQRNIKSAFEKLDQINKEISKEFTWGTFDEKYREAKRSNPNFTFQIREDLPEQLNLDFWNNYVARCNRIMSNQQVITEGMISMVQLNNWDQAMAYSAQLKTMYETFTGAAENLGSANLLKFAYDLHGNMNDFIENYKKIEKAKLEGQEIENFQVDFNKMTSKARRSKTLYNKYIESIRKNQGMIVDFEYNIKHIHKLKKNASLGPLLPLSYADRKYNWDYENYENQVKEICDKFEDYEIECSNFKKDYSDIKTQARSNWNSTKGNIYASDDESHKQEFLDHHTERWAEFLRQVEPVYDNTYQIYCVDNSAPDEQNTDNPPDGSTAEAGTATTTQENSASPKESSFVIENFNIKEEMTSFGGGKPFIDINYDIYFPNEVPGNFGYLQNLELDGIKITQNTRWRTIFMGYKEREKQSISFNLPDGKGDGTYKLKLVLNVNKEEQSISTSITVKGKSVHQGKSSSSSSNNGSTELIPEPQKDNTTEREATNQNESARDNNNSEGSYKPPPKTSGNSSAKIPSNAFLVGSISNTGNRQGTYKYVEIKKLKAYDKIVFKLISGQLEYIQLIWRKEGGIWETEYSGNKTEFDIAKGLKNIPAKTTHLNFVVNSQHNRWSANDKACKMEVYLIPSTGGMSSKGFYDLIDQANEAFNANYWDEEQGNKSSSNPKQKSLDLLRKAERMINREPDFNTQLEMVELLVNTSTDYAKRVHAYTAKTPFMELAGKRLHRTSTSIPSAFKSSNTYSKIASMWRTLTGAALWGDHAFNKMYCEKEFKKYSALAGE
jgi:hypothetical protein